MDGANKNNEVVGVKPETSAAITPLERAKSVVEDAKDWLSQHKKEVTTSLAALSMLGALTFATACNAQPTPDAGMPQSNVAALSTEAPFANPETDLALARAVSIQSGKIDIDGQKYSLPLLQILPDELGPFANNPDTELSISVLTGQKTMMAQQHTVQLIQEYLRYIYA